MRAPSSSIRAGYWRAAMIHAPTAAPPGYDGLLGFAQQRHVQHFPFRLTLLGVIARLDRAIHMWTAPGPQEVVQRADRIACDHMSGLLMRSHMTAAKMGFAT